MPLASLLVERTVAGMHVETLINLTGRDVFVYVDGDRVPLPAGPRPAVLERPDPAPGALNIASLGATLQVSAATTAAMLFLPEPADGVAYLVAAELVARLPHRDDLFCAHSFRIDRDPTGSGSTLIAVSSQRPPIGPDVQLVQLGDFDEDTESGAPDGDWPGAGTPTR